MYIYTVWVIKRMYTAKTTGASVAAHLNRGESRYTTNLVTVPDGGRQQLAAALAGTSWANLFCVFVGKRTSMTQTARALISIQALFLKQTS